MTAICVNGLRTNASIISAFMNQCDRVIPVDSVEEAVIAGKQFPGDSIITGGLDIRDKFFELTNSPLEFTEEAVAGKVIIHCSGNGSRCIKASFDAKNSFVGHLINATAVAKRVLREDDDIYVVGAGTSGRLSLVDMYYMGSIVDRMCTMDNSLVLDDCAMLALKIYREFRDRPKEFMAGVESFEELISIGGMDDIDYCLREDIADIVPKYEEGVIVLEKDGRNL